MNNYWTICVTCRKGWRGSPTCGHETQVMHRNFRMPRRRDDRAWRRLAAGEVNTEISAVDRHYREQVQALYDSRVNPMYTVWRWGAYYASGGRDFWVKRRFPADR